MVNIFKNLYTEKLKKNYSEKKTDYAFYTEKKKKTGEGKTD